MRLHPETYAFRLEIGLSDDDECASLVDTMAIRPRMTMGSFIAYARSTLALSQRQFGEALHASHRTATRWDAGHSQPSEVSLRKLAAMLLPVNRELAVECAAHMGKTLVDLGLEAPPPPPAPPPAPYTSVDLVDIVVCAAAEAWDGSPRAMRSLLHVAFRRAREMGLKVEQVEAALAPSSPPPASKPAGTRSGAPRTPA